MKKVSLILSAVVMAAILLSSCSGGKPKEVIDGGDSKEVTDGGPSKEVTLSYGGTVWMTKNLDVSTFRNGDPIPEAKTDEEWRKAAENKQPAWCYYDNDPANGKKVGKLYNWYAVNDPRGLAPIGYHISTNEEWAILEEALGQVRKEEKAVAKIKSENGWGGNYNGTNSSDFSALPGGKRTTESFYTSTFLYIESGAYWWTSTEDEESSSEAWFRHIEYNGLYVENYISSKGEGYSVRCVKD